MSMWDFAWREGKALSRSALTPFLAFLFTGIFGCDGTDLAQSPLAACRFPSESGTPAIRDGRADIRIVYLLSDPDGITLAREVAGALSSMTGTPFPYAAITAATSREDALCRDYPGCQAHGISVGELSTILDGREVRPGVVRTTSLVVSPGRRLWLIEGSNRRERSHAVNRFLYEFGVRHFHPTVSYFPSRPNLYIPASIEQTQSPGIGRRGWRFDTLRASPAARALLEPGATNAQLAAHMFRWLLRNGQTHVEWSLPKTRLPEWDLYTGWLIAEAGRNHLVPGAHVALFRGRDGLLSLGQSREGWYAESQTLLDELTALGFKYVSIDLTSEPSSRPAAGQLAQWLRWLEATAQAKGIELRADLPLDADSDLRSAVFAGTAAINVAGLAPYGLFAQAHVSGSPFERQVADMEREIGHRSVAYMPELSSQKRWDLDVPVFLPAYWYSRWLDINGLLSYPEIGLLSVDRGWEWGYWANAAVIAALSWDPGLSYVELTQRTFSPLGRNTCERFTDSLTAMGSEQYRFSMEDGMLPFILGQTPADEALGEETRIRPFRPRYADLVTLDASQAVTWETNVMVPMNLFIGRWTGIERGLFTAMPRVDEPARPFIQEFIDGIVVTRLRLEHSQALLRAALAVRDGDMNRARAYLEVARDKTNIAGLVITAREGQYRFPAEELAGVHPNQTAYPYGYLYHAHKLDAWVREDDEVARLVYPKE